MISFMTGNSHNQLFLGFSTIHPLSSACNSLIDLHMSSASLFPMRTFSLSFQNLMYGKPNGKSCDRNAWGHRRAPGIGLPLALEKLLQSMPKKLTSENLI